VEDGQMEGNATSAEAQLRGGPLIFSGVPPIVAGDLELANPTDEKVKVRAIQVAGHEDPAIARFGLSELRVGVRLAPNERTRAHAHFLIDPQTPPGTYTAELSYGGEQQRIVVHVFEKVDLRVEPEVIRLRGAGGDVLNQLVILRNRGNVTETLRDLALVFLEERDWVGRSLVYALRETKQGEGHQAYFDRVIEELRSTIARPARVTIQGEVRDLRPGDTAEVGLEITLPRELKTGRTYVGSTPFMSGALSFEIECNGAVNSTRRRPR
jgi:hypothetical protein